MPDYREKYICIEWLSIKEGTQLVLKRGSLQLLLMPLLMLYALLTSPTAP